MTDRTIHELGYASHEEWARDLRAGVGEAYRDHLRRFHPEFDDVPPELIPWPYRASDVAGPTHCPKCGRVLVHYWWHGSEGAVGYHEVACAGWLQPLLWLAPGLGFFLHHWQLGVGENDRPKLRKWRYDPLSGEPMDGIR